MKLGISLELPYNGWKIATQAFELSLLNFFLASLWCFVFLLFFFKTLHVLLSREANSIIDYIIRSNYDPALTCPYSRQGVLILWCKKWLTCWVGTVLGEDNLHFSNYLGTVLDRASGCKVEFTEGIPPNVRGSTEKCSWAFLADMPLCSCFMLLTSACDFG